MMRLFVAVCLSREMKDEISGTIRSLKKSGVRGRYVPVDNLHMTLAFIGETDDVEKVEEALSKVRWEPFFLSLSGMGNFGDIVWIGSGENKALSAAAAGVRAALEEAGIPYDRKKFVPHITLIRRASGNWRQVSENRQQALAKLPASKKQMRVDRISLMKSEEIDGRRVYTEVFAI